MNTLYYKIPKNHPHHKLITEFQAKREIGIKARRKLARTIKNHDGFSLNNGNWGFTIKKKKTGFTTTTLPWDEELLRHDRRDDMFVPNRKTAKGKALLKEMQDPKYHIAGSGDFGKAIGISPQLVYERGGMYMVNPKYAIISAGRHAGTIILQLHKQHKPKPKYPRICDIEYEKLTASETKALARPKRKKVKA